MSDIQQEIMIKIHPIRIYVNKISIRFAFKIKTGYCLKNLTPQAIKLLKSTEDKINKNRNSRNYLL